VSASDLIGNFYGPMFSSAARPSSQVTLTVRSRILNAILIQ